VSDAHTTDAPPAWLPERKTAAIVFTVDDVHPGRSTDAYEAGGDLSAGALGHVERLLSRHPDLKATLFVTADWREMSPVPTRRVLEAIPFLRDRVYLAPRYPRGRMRLDRHPEFARYISSLPRTEIALHGLHHVHRGRRIPMEFQNQSRAECRTMLEDAISIFAAANIPFVKGLTPPAFNAPEALIEAATDLGFSYIASSRDIRTPIARDALSRMTGLRGTSLIFPGWLAAKRLVHVPTNFQATSSFERARAIVELGGLLSIKAHIIKDAMGHIALDGLDDTYAGYLDSLFSDLRNRFGDALWWATPDEIAQRMMALERGSSGARAAATESVS